MEIQTFLPLYIEPLVQGILNLLPWYIEPPTTVYWTLSMVYWTSYHGILKPYLWNINQLYCHISK